METALGLSAFSLFVLAARRRALARAPRVAYSSSSHLSKSQRIASGGPRELVVVMDFDRTMTTFWGPRGGRGSSCHGIVEGGPKFSPVLRAKAEALNAFYYPIEVDGGRSAEEKIPYMRDWYTHVNNLFVEAGLRREDLVDSVRHANVGLRPGIPEVLEWARENDVPVLIFSAGIGDVIEEVLRQKHVGELPANTRILSNWMLWEGESLVGFSDPVVHMFNKDVAHIAGLLAGGGATAGAGGGGATTSIGSADAAGEARGAGAGARAATAALPSTLTARVRSALGVVGGTDWLAPFSDRRNVVLLGDGPGDVTMANGLLGADSTVLRVGFLNDNVDSLLPKFVTAGYDVLVTHDGPAYNVVDLLQDTSRTLRSPL
jgi:phosphoserine phosphatase